MVNVEGGGLFYQHKIQLTFFSEDASWTVFVGLNGFLPPLKE